jgi:1,4-alpha-glucan branching enzyme
MGGELGQQKEWDHDSGLEWDLLEHDMHKGLQRWVRDLNTLYRGEPALHELDCEATGFEWIDCNDSERSTLAYLRRGRATQDVVVICNFTPVPRSNFRVGVPRAGHWREDLNSDAQIYGGSGQGNLGGSQSAPVSCRGHAQSIAITLPPLAVLVFKSESGPAR